MMRWPVRGLALWLLLLASAGGQTILQTLPRGYDVTSGNGEVGATFSSSTSAFTAQYVYDSTEFAHQGPIVVQEIYVRSHFIFAAPVTYPSLTVTLGVSTDDYTNLSSAFALNLTQPSVVLSGSQTIPFAWSTWVPLGITPGSVYDPSLGQDFLIQIERCGGTAGWGIDGHVGWPGASQTNPSVPVAWCGTGSCAGGTASFSNVGSASIFRIEYQAACNTTAQWQVNQPTSELRLDGLANNACSPIEQTRAVGQTSFLELNSTLVGSPWDLGVTSSPGISVANGGLVTPGGQIINLDLGAAGLIFVQNWAFTNAFNPGTVPVASSVPLDVYAQLIVLDPSMVDGFSLSATNELHFLSCAASTTGPLATGVTTIPVACIGANAPASIPLYGTSYTEIHVASSGHVMFGGGALVGGPATLGNVQLQFPLVGIWANFSASAASITVSNPAPDVILIDYVGLDYMTPGHCAMPNPLGCALWVPGTQVGPNNFAVELDWATGAVTILGLQGIIQSSATMFAGISLGRNGATDGGQADFSTLGNFVGPTNMDMIYEFGSMNAVLPGLTGITFIPNGSGNYDWTSF